MSKTLRLLMPQWQGGNNPPYSFGAKLLAWLAPEAGDTPQVEVPVESYDGTELEIEDGIAGRSVLMRQLQSAGKIIEAHEPERIIVFGGDCLIAQAPFAYLNEKYDGRLGVLWLDAHPDALTPVIAKHAHTMVLGNLLGAGDPEFAAEVKVKLDPKLVLYGGLQEMSAERKAVVEKLELAEVGPGELADSSASVLKWIEENQIEHLAIHFDLDVLDPKLFRSQLFANPAAPPNSSPSGEMTFEQIGRIISDVSAKTDVVGLAIAEHLPWDSLNLHNFLAGIPIFKQ